MICNIFSLLGLMEKRGSGFDKIAKDYEGYGESFAPFASSDSQSFVLTLPDLAHEGGIIGEMACPPVHTNLETSGKHDLRILSYCYGQGRTAVEIADHLNLTPSSYFRSSVLDPLVKQGYLRISKSGRTAFYQSNPDKVLVD